MPPLTPQSVRAASILAGASDAARTERILGKLRQARLLDAMQQAAENKGSRHLAEKALLSPDGLAKADEFIGDYGMSLGRHLGAGAESLVWEVVPRNSPDRHVLKLRPDGLASDFDFPDGLPGVSPYWAAAQAGPNLAVALQPRADALWRPVHGMTRVFEQGSRRLKNSLLARGWQWDDNHIHNIGVSPEGEWTAIDGFLYKSPHQSDGVDEYWKKWGPQPSPEEAIRMLRVTPGEREVIYGAP